MIDYSTAEVNLSILIWAYFTDFVVATLQNTAKQIWFWYLQGVFCSNAKFFFLFAIVHRINLKLWKRKIQVF